jgi:hypothetical protein
MGILEHEKMITEIAGAVVKAYIDRVKAEIAAEPWKNPWDTSTGTVVKNQVRGQAW